MSNIYYEPEDFGLVVVGEIEYSSGGYEFDTRVVWRRIEDGKLFTARDSGCSCPTPFENYNLDNIDALDYQELRREVLEEMGCNNYSRTEKAHEFLKVIKDAE